MVSIKQETCEVNIKITKIKTSAFVNDIMQGQLELHLEENNLIIDAAILQTNLNSETISQIKFGLIRMALSCAYKIFPYTYISGKGLESEITYLEQLFPIFKLEDLDYKKVTISKKMVKKLLPHEFSPGSKYILVSHGERIETNNITMLVLEGMFETEESSPNKINLNGDRGMELFNPRERFKINDVFNKKSVFSIANGQLIELHGKVEEKNQPKIAPYGVSAYNGFVLSHVLVSLHELGWFDLINSDISKTRIIASDKIKLNCNNIILNGLYDFISGAGIINLSPDKLSYTVNESAYYSLQAEIGYLKFILQGYNEVFTETVPLAKGEKQYWKDIRRNDDGVSEFLLTYSQNVEPAVFETVGDLGFKKMAYLGCGNAVRLIELCKSNPDAKAVGVEIDPKVAKIARENIKAAGLSDRIEILEEDLSSWVDRPQKDVDLVLFIVGMAHDFLKNKERAYSVFWKMKNNISPNARMVLEDINIQENNDPWSGMTINKGFELVHALMGVNLGTREKYESVFKHFGWEVEFVRGTGLANAWIYVIKSDLNENGETSFELTEEMAETL